MTVVVGFAVAVLVVHPAWWLAGGREPLGTGWWLASALAWWAVAWALWLAGEFWLGWGCVGVATLCAWEGRARCHRPSPGGVIE